MIYQMLGLMMLANVDELKRLYIADKVVNDQREKAENESLRRRRAIRYEWELQLTAPKWIALTLIIGLMLGALGGHNLLSRVVVCEQEVCSLLRLDGRTIDY